MNAEKGVFPMVVARKACLLRYEKATIALVAGPPVKIPDGAVFTF
jgi:hypothetical protein